ncbi:hypothetical protein Y1Q_0023244 [Alligator mississippiensis]|uniref:Uncharacterized protein n=1 Tax=Alligator mississippiensis TaxID=8496 RepID=A0A151MJB1_ALLMI|nr:hypothetical protein Y1Q_0023244 [Alligator mississippiensis]
MTECVHQAFAPWSSHSSFTLLSSEVSIERSSVSLKSNSVVLQDRQHEMEGGGKWTGGGGFTLWYSTVSVPGISLTRDSEDFQFPLLSAPAASL